MRSIICLALLVSMCLASACASTSDAADGMQAPQVVQRVEPEYPQHLRQARIQGIVVIGGTVPKEGGALRNIHVIRSDDQRLEPYALNAVSQWVWEPGLVDGEPADMEFQTTVHFSLR